MAWQLVFKDSGRSVSLISGAHEIGSRPGAEIRIEHPTVSRRHARLQIEGEAIVIEDLESSNGTRIDGRLVARPTSVDHIRQVAFGLVEAELRPLEDAEAENAMSMGQAAAPSGETRHFDTGTLVAETAGRFAVEELISLLELARRRRDPVALAARMLTALKQSFDDLDFALETRDGHALAGRIEPETHFDEAAAGDCVVRVHGRRARRMQALPAARLCAELLDLVRDQPAEPQPSPAAPQSGKRPDPPTLSPKVRELYDRAERVAPSRLSVLIEGETGTGKELLARYLHASSGRQGEFVAVNCAALPRDLLEAELFGIEAGVATGVDARDGRFVQAEGGTLLLDEITELSDDCQAKLLRVLQEGEVVAVGARRPRSVDVRIIAATNRCVSARSDRPGPLRPDLVHRLAGWKALLPTLSDRAEDIPQLAAHFFSRAAGEAGRRPAGISRAAIDALCGYDWPGNVRELEQEMQRAALFVDHGELLGRRHLSPEIAETSVAPVLLQDVGTDAQRQAIEQTLAAHGGNATRAAEALGISRATLYRRMREFGIQRNGNG